MLDIPLRKREQMLFQMFKKHPDDDDDDWWWYTQAQGLQYQVLQFIGNYDLKPLWQIFPIDSNVNLPIITIFYINILAIMPWK